MNILTLFLGALSLFILLKLSKYNKKHMKVGPTCSLMFLNNRDQKQDHWFIISLTEFVRCQLAHGKGAAFFVKPDSGILGPFERITINITAFTNMWGDYHDNLMCKVSQNVFKSLNYFSNQPCPQGIYNVF